MTARRLAAKSFVTLLLRTANAGMNMFQLNWGITGPTDICASSPAVTRRDSGHPDSVLAKSLLGSVRQMSDRFISVGHLSGVLIAVNGK